ncbi:MAG: hypothetical protein AAFO69_05980 [Bacteroidota bacterium]
MKSVIFSFVLTFVSLAAMAQTPIDGLQKQNITYLESLESKGYEFRSQIITEFDQANASQNVNINLSKDYTYVVVALGDSNIPGISLEIKPSSKAKIDQNDLNSGMTGQSYQLSPSKSGRFKFSIDVTGLSGGQKGFVSFMVLRK